MLKDCYDDVRNLEKRSPSSVGNVYSQTRNKSINFASFENRSQDFGKFCQDAGCLAVFRPPFSRAMKMPFPKDNLNHIVLIGSAWTSIMKKT